MRNKIKIALLMALLPLAACSPPAPPTAPQPPPLPGASTSEHAEPADPRFIGRVWISTTSGSARGSIMVFLPDRTLLMDSCFETFRLSKWGVADDRIRWIEETVPIEAEVVLPSKNEMRLRIAGQDREQSYVAAAVPYVCPDMPR